MEHIIILAHVALIEHRHDAPVIGKRGLAALLAAFFPVAQVAAVGGDSSQSGGEGRSSEIAWEFVKPGVKIVLWCRVLFTGMDQQLEGSLPLLLVSFVSGPNVIPLFVCDIDKVSNSLPVDVNGRPQNAASIQKFDPIA